ncbi:MAG: glycogen phosphorylase [Candidatus Brocadiaceae bacterium]|nr:glycogen phosphorylase [Candidatus Brocadiaceae bacterium]
MAMAYDTPIPGYRNNTVNNLRLWAAKSTREFDFSYFNEGNYIRAVENKQRSEIISKVLYPNDDKFEGKELRLKQEYFFVSATLQDVMRRFKKGHHDFSKFNDKVAVQLNDTHPAIAIPELMRTLIDVEHLDWEKAWEITVKTFGYTNHTILPEALEKWSVSLMERVLPRHIQIIYEINRRFLSEVAYRFPGSSEHQQAMSLIDENGEKKVCMAHLAIVGSHSTNGVAALHTELLKSHVFKPFYEMFPERFYNITNGITQRRWLQKCNPELAQLITKNIGDGWVKNLQELKKLIPFAEDKGFRDEWRKIKLSNKLRLTEYLMHNNTFAINVNAMFDCQVKRIHEYKRQLLNVLHVIYLYNKIRANPTAEYTPRSVIIGGKAAPGYATAKLIIKLINSVADVVNNDPVIGGRLRLYFLANYRVSLAENTIPATDLSEQISTAGTEASGTGNMKFALNGALTIGTLDGANIEIKKEVGDDNIFIFGMTVEEIKQLKNKGYSPYDYYQKNPELKEVIDMIGNGHFSPQHPYVFRPIVDSLLYQGDQYFLLADFASYVSCQERVSRLYRDREEWTKKSILNVARIGVFSSDRSIQEYAQKVWGVSASPVILTP